MSLMSRKNTGDRAKQRAVDGALQAKQRAVETASQMGPMARNAVPVAKNVGLAAKQSAEDAVAWATPRVMDARSWAAPHVEQAGVAVRDKIAPAISEKIAPAISSALVETAHRIDVNQAQRRRWPRVLAGFAMIAAVGSAVAAVVLRRKPDFSSLGSEDQAPDGGTSSAQDNGSATTPTVEEDSANGRTSRSS
jgi:hypothetical protein